jgi:RNA polymerase sigma-70 factor (ECF subfamily)
LQRIDTKKDGVTPVRWKPTLHGYKQELRLAPDAQLVLRCRSGEIACFGILVERYQEVVLRVAYHHLGNWQDAQDAAQDAFVKSYLRLDSYDPARPFRNWLLRILINHCIDRRRWKRRRQAEVLNRDLVDDRESPSTTIDRSEAIQRVLSRLSPRQRRILILRDLEGFTPDEVAEILGCRPATVRVHHFHARNRFREEWRKLENE